MENMCLIFKEAIKMFFKVLIQFHTPSSNIWYLGAERFLIMALGYIFLMTANSVSIFSCTYWTSIHILCEVSLQVFCSTFIFLCPFIELVLFFIYCGCKSFQAHLHIQFLRIYDLPFQLLMMSIEGYFLKSYFHLFFLLWLLLLAS